MTLDLPDNRVIIDDLTEAGKLKSIDFATVVDVLSEGEIEGSATASKDRVTNKTSVEYTNCLLKDLFLNKTAVLQADADNTSPLASEFNYPLDRFRFEMQDGTANNTVLFAANSQSSEVITGDKNQVCSFPAGGFATPRSGTITNINIDTVQIKVKFDNFFKLNTETGNRDSTEVRVLCKVNPNNGNAVTVINDLVSGKSFNPYSRDYGIDLRTVSGYNTNTSGASGSFFPVVVSVERFNDEGDSNTFNTMRLAEIRQFVREPNNYPHIAYSALRFSSELFQNTPARYFRIRGKLVKIPHNATVDYTNGRLIYSGNFNGTFKSQKAWCSDPAWILYDLLITQSDRNADQQYGCGIPESELDQYTFYGVSKYCSALVDDGNNGLEPRFSLNVNINNRRDALSLIKDICSVMRAIPYYEEGTIKIAQDAPKNPDIPSELSFDYVFNNANVVDGDFTYTGASSKTRFNVINVSFFDLDTQEIDYVTVKDSVTQQKYGTHTKTINTFGTTSRGQSQRVGKWFLQTQQNQVESVAFTTNIAAGSILRIGNIIGIADRVKSGIRRGGIVKSSTTSTVTIDSAAATNLPALNDTPEISCLLSDSSVATKTISSYNGNIVNITPNFSSNNLPVNNSPFIINSAAVNVQAYRILNIKEETNKTYTVSAINFNEGKYAAIEDGEQLPAKNINVVTTLLPSPQIIDNPDGTKAIQEIIVLNNNRPVPKLFIDWESVTGAAGYQLVYTKDDENPIVVNTQQSEFEVLPSEAGNYKIQIYTINIKGERSASPTETTVNTIGLTAPPENPTNLEIEPINNAQVKLTWTKTRSLDVEFGGSCVVRHTPRTLLSATFADSDDLSVEINGASNEAIVPALQGTYSLKFKDLGERLSVTEAKVELSLPEMSDEVLILSQREQPSFSGTKNDLSVVSNALQLTNPATSLTGSYEFASVFDLQGVFTNIRLKRHILSTGVLVSDLFDSIADLDARENFDGQGSERLKAKLQVETSQDASSYTNAQNLTNGSFSARSFKFIGNIISLDVNENMKFEELGFDAFLLSRTENKYQSGGSITSAPQQSGTSSSGKTVTFAKPFFTGTSATIGGVNAFKPSIVISPEDMPLGGTYVLSAVSGTGFTILFKDSSNSPTDVLFTFQALGYGKGA